VRIVVSGGGGGGGGARSWSTLAAADGTMAESELTRPPRRDVGMAVADSEKDNDGREAVSDATG
jgi:hypothetical protein